MIDNSSILKEIRKDRGLTIQAVCDGAGIAVRTYQNYEYGKREISAEALCRLADFYGVSADYLLGRAEKPDPFASLKLLNGEKNAMEKYIELPENIRKIILDTMLAFSDATKQKSDNK